MKTICKTCGQECYVDKIRLSNSLYVRSVGDCLVLFIDNGIEDIYNIMMDTTEIQNFINVYESWKGSDE